MSNNLHVSKEAATVPYDQKRAESEQIAKHIAEFGEHRIERIPRGVTGIVEKRTHAGLTSKQRDALSKKRQEENKAKEKKSA